MTLGCGSYGPPLKVEKVEKEWPVNRSKIQFEIERIALEDKHVTIFIIWLESGKFYYAEFVNEIDN